MLFYLFFLLVLKVFRCQTNAPWAAFGADGGAQWATNIRKKWRRCYTSPLLLAIFKNLRLVTASILAAAYFSFFIYHLTMVLSFQLELVHAR